MKDRNNVRLTCLIPIILVGHSIVAEDASFEQSSHFKLREFENKDGIAVVHETLLLGLELVHRDLREIYGPLVEVIITNGTRTERDNDALAERFGWTTAGGLVSPDSTHLVEYGGIAADITGWYGHPPGTYEYESGIKVDEVTWHRVDEKKLGDICRKHFDHVKDDYEAIHAHVHVDQRDGGKKLKDAITPAKPSLEPTLGED